MKLKILLIVVLALLMAGCTQETQNKFGRAVQNYTGANGVLDIYMGEKLVQRYVKVDKLSTAQSTQGEESRNYRYGYGYLDLNQNYKADEGEKKLYFEISEYATPYVFYENPVH